MGLIPTGASCTGIIIIVALIVLHVCLIQGQAPVARLPDCSKLGTSSVIPSRSSILVSTLDGRLSSYELKNDEWQEVWSKSFGDKPLVSSTVENIEFYARGIPHRMIPSLDGSLFTFDGHRLEQLPIDVDSLLRSTFKAGDDVLINGRRESISFGVNRSDGNVLYECNFDGCDSSHDNKVIEENEDGILLIERQSQGVRAHDPRGGGEKWNIFTSQYRVNLLNQGDDCKFTARSQEDTTEKTNFQVRLHLSSSEVLVINLENSSIVWKKKFDIPVASVWLVDSTGVKIIDPFSSFQNQEIISSVSDEPVLYLGKFSGQRDQLYVQSSSKYSPGASLDVHKDVKRRTGNTMIEYKPKKSTRPTSTGSELVVLEIDLIVASSSSGIFLYEDATDKTCGLNINTSETKGSRSKYSNETILDSSFDQVIVVSLWHWWKEVLALSIFIAVIINIVIAYTKRHIKDCISPCVSPEVSCEGGGPKRSSSDSGSIPSNSSPSSLTIISSEGYATRNASPLSLSPLDSFPSRFLLEFDEIRCLGKGGFGVVFQARRKFDERSYAIKRIRLPSKPEAREKVMREVKALANLEHSNIVRYFYSWLEEPPSGWQEMKDKELLSNLTSHGEVLSSHVNFSRNEEDPSQVLRQRKQNGKKSPQNNFVFNVNRKEPSFSDAVQTNGDSDYIVFETNEDSKDQEKKSCSLISKRLTPFKSVAFQEEQEPCSPLIPKPYLYIQMELCEKYTLREWLLRHKATRDKVYMIWIFKQITQAVEYVHEVGLMHRDLKPSNIFFSLDGTVKVGDFGLVTASENNTPYRISSEDNLSEVVNRQNASGIHPRHTNNVGTCLYMSPEQLSGQSYCNKVDVFSLGVIFFELLVPFETEMERMNILKNVRDRIFPKRFPSSFPEEHNLTKKLLAPSPSERPAANEILSHTLLIQTKPQDGSRRRTISVSDP